MVDSLLAFFPFGIMDFCGNSGARTKNDTHTLAGSDFIRTQIESKEQWHSFSLRLLDDKHHKFGMTFGSRRDHTTDSYADQLNPIRTSLVWMPMPMPPPPSPPLLYRTYTHTHWQFSGDFKTKHSSQRYRSSSNDYCYCYCH